MTQVGTSCGVTTVAVRDYAEDSTVFVGDQFDVHLRAAPGSAQIFVADRSESAQELRMTATRKTGPGRLLFNGPTATARGVALPVGQRRLASGWPPHWAADAVITGPGCWHLKLTSTDATDVVVFEIREKEWADICRSATLECRSVVP